MTRHLSFAAVALAVVALYFAGCSNEETNPTDVPPATPSNLTVQQTIRTQVDLSWFNVADEDSFIVQRSLDSSSWSAIVNLGQDVLSTMDIGIRANQQHWYRVASKNIAGSSAFSSPASIWTWPAVYDFAEDETENFTTYCPDGPDFLEWVWYQPSQSGMFTLLVPTGGQTWASLQANDTLPNQGWFECKVKVGSWSDGIDSMGFFVSRDPSEARDAVGIKFMEDSTWLVYYTAAGRMVGATNPVLPVMTDNVWHSIRLFHQTDQWVVYYDGTQYWNGSIPNVAVGAYGLIQEWQMDSGAGPESQSIWLDDLANPAASPALLHASADHGPHLPNLYHVARPAKK